MVTLNMRKVRVEVIIHYESHKRIAFSRIRINYIIRPYKVNSMFCVLRFPKTYQPAREKNTHNKKHTRHKYDTTRRILYKNNQFTISLLQIAQLYENRIYRIYNIVYIIYNSFFFFPPTTSLFLVCSSFPVA